MALGDTAVLSRRGCRQYIRPAPAKQPAVHRDRVTRLLIPFVVGSILLSPPQAYLEALHEGTYRGSFLSFIPQQLADRTSGNLVSPHTFGRWGYHLWHLGFLFAYSLLALPIFRWFKRDAGQSFVSWLGRLAEKRGGLLLLVLPLALSRALILPYFPEERGWLDFVYTFLFFVLGYVVYSDDRFLVAVRRDRWLLFAGGLLGLVGFFRLSQVVGDVAFEWALTFVMPGSVIIVLIFTHTSWCWALNIPYLAMRYLDRTNRWFTYGNDTIMSFYLLHQPVIISIAFFVVRWDAGVTMKLLVIVISSFLVTLGLSELLIRPFKPMRVLFGMKT